MPVSEAKKRANNKWSAANMTVLGCKVRKDLADEFREACRRADTTPNAVFRQAIEDFMGSENPEGGAGK